MTKTQYYCAATLDGYIADSEDGIDWLTGYEGSAEIDGESDPMSEGGSYESFYEGVGALVSGSVTYEWVLAHYADPWPYPGKPWWVLSSRELSIPDSEGVDVRLRRGDVTALRQEMFASAEGRNLWIVGGGNVASQFANAGMLDEVLVTVVPVVLGEGKPLFARALPGGPMQLTGVTPHANGMVLLRYGLGR